MMARWIGAAPRQRGSSEACRLRQPSRGASSACLRQDLAIGDDGKRASRSSAANSASTSGIAEACRAYGRSSPNSLGQLHGPAFSPFGLAPASHGDEQAGYRRATIIVSGSGQSRRARRRQIQGVPMKARRKCHGSKSMLSGYGPAPRPKCGGVKALHRLQPCNLFAQRPEFLCGLGVADMRLNAIEHAFGRVQRADIAVLAIDPAPILQQG
jgi:hypothetical protein